MSIVNSPIRTYLFRPAGAESGELLTEIHAEAFANYWNPNDFNDFFAVPGTRALVAEMEGRKGAAGMVVVRVAGEQADIITIAVRPGARRQGLGRALMLQSIDIAKNLGAKHMFLDVEEGNHPAIRLYEDMGFRHLSRRKLYYRQKNGGYTDALVMTCKLA